MTQCPPLKAEINRLQRSIHAELKKTKEHAWDSLLADANFDVDSLHKIIARGNRKNTSCPLLLGFRGLVYGTKEKADLFVDSLEESFTENRTP
ncbi:hypothetical protein TNIN_315321 [Trichonephila inaurata madagascariensis]|nr:hypothetical protein TNIN_315321 [Trichonephila inaurata madagascariensis]